MEKLKSAFYNCLEFSLVVSFRNISTTIMPVDKNPSPTPSQTNNLNSNPSQNSPKKSNHHQNQVPSQTTPCPNPQNQNQRLMFHPHFYSLHLLKLQSFASLTSCLQHPSFPPTLAWKSIIRCYTSHGLSHQFIAMRTSGKYPDRQATVDELEVG